MTPKDLKKEINAMYLKYFLGITDYSGFERVNKGGGYVDEYDDYFYISPEYSIDDDKSKFQFYVKKHWTNLRVEVRTVPPPGVTGPGYCFKIYLDILHLKLKNPIKEKIKDIANGVKYNQYMKRVGNSNSFDRALKIKKLRKKLGK